MSNNTNIFSEIGDFNYGQKPGLLGHSTHDFKGTNIHLTSKSYSENSDLHCIFRSKTRSENSNINFLQSSINNKENTILHELNNCSSKESIIDISVINQCWCPIRLDMIYKTSFRAPKKTTVFLSEKNLKENGFELYISSDIDKNRTLFLAVQGSNGVRYIELQNTDVNLIRDLPSGKQTTLRWISMDISRKNHIGILKHPNEDSLYKSEEAHCSHQHKGMCFDCSPAGIQKRLNHLLSD